jgi:hypothetical protein
VSGPSASNDIDALYKLPLDEFTAARNALVAQLKRDGRKAEASEAKALAKPSASAWAVNQLYWRHRKLFDQLLETGERLRRAHAAQLTGDAARDPINARREVVARLAGIAADLLRDANQIATRDLMRRVTSTLEALSIYGSLAGAPAAGRLTGDLEPPGFEAVAGLLPASGGRAAGGRTVQMRLPQTRPATKRPSSGNSASVSARRGEEDRKRRIAAAKVAVREAERALNAALKQAERAATKVETAAARAKALDAERAQIEKQLSRAAKDAEAAHVLAREAAANANEATQAAQDAERAVEAARGRLRETAASGD